MSPEPKAPPNRARFPLRFKLLALTTLVLTLLMATVTYVHTIRQQSERLAAAQADVERIARNVATYQLLENQDWDAYQAYISRLLQYNPDIVYLAVLDDRAALRAWALNTTVIDLGIDRPLSRREQGEVVRALDSGAVAAENRGDLRSERINIQLGDRVLGSVHVAVSLLEVNRRASLELRHNVVIALFFVILSAVLSSVLSRRLTRPIEQLSEAMEAVGAGDLARQVEPQTRDEIAILARDFNQMVAELRERQEIDRLGRELGRVFQVERLAPLVRERVREAVGAAHARLFVRVANRPGAFREVGDPADSGLNPATFLLSAAAREGIRERGGGLCPEATPEEARPALRTVGAAPGDLLLPMTVQGQLFGLLLLRPDTAARPLDQQRVRLARTLAGQAALALDNALLYDELREQERLRGELQLAREVQRRLLPRDLPLAPGLSFEAFCVPAQEVGGDYYDFHRLDGDRLGIVIADVSGKGTSASLYMAELKGMMLSLAFEDPSPRRALVELNRRLYPTLDRRIFASILYAVIDLAAFRVRFVRAGHTPLVLLPPRGAPQILAPSGMAVGLDPGPLFERTLDEATVQIEPGTGLIAFTDGITDARDPGGAAFGMTRLLEVAAAAASAGRPPGEALLGAVRGFVGGEPSFDDLTLVAVRRTAPGNPPAHST